VNIVLVSVKGDRTVGVYSFVYFSSIVYFFYEIELIISFCEQNFDADCV